MSRLRHPTDEERAFFEETFKDARPLPKMRRPPAAKAGARKSAQPQPPAAPAKARAWLSEDVPPIAGRRETRLRRGRLEPQARLDLHGLTQDEAHRALLRFFVRAHGLDQRLVLVITGKRGVLRGLVPRWLAEAAFRPLVAGLRSAHIRHGGEGAFYVALKKGAAPARTT